VVGVSAMKDFFELFGDSYARNARLYPALVVLAPLAVAAVVLGHIKLEWSVAPYALGASIMAYALAQAARGAGRRIEPGLVARWGGWPTTRLLRHRDTTIDRITKGRYHARLCKLDDAIQLPSRDEESLDPARADEQYESAVHCLREQRRDAKYKIVHDENAAYGFRRNLLGLKPYGVVACLLAITVAWLCRFGELAVAGEQRAGVVVHWPAYGIGAISAVLLLVWTFVISSSFVHAAGLNYARTLLRTLDGS
jgi:hypothetical protein